MRIILPADTYYPDVNGASYSVQTLAHYLQKIGHEVLVITTSLTFKPGFFSHNNINIYGVSSVPLFVNGFRYAQPFYSRQKLRQVILDFKPDIIHLQSHFYVDRQVYKIAKQFNIPVVGTNHFMPENLLHYLHMPDFIDNLISRIAWWQFGHVYDHLDGVAAPTKTAADLLVKKTGFAIPVVPISNGIDFTIYNKDNNGDYLKKRYRLPDKPTLLYLGRLDKEKNLDFVLRCLPAVLKKIDMHLVIVGKGREENKLRTLARELGISSHITFTGFISDEDKPNIYRIADCFIIACAVELQSIVTMEALASGLPVIGMDALALPELIHHGENGYLFKEGDSQSVSDYIAKILSNKDLQQKMSVKSLEIIKKHDMNSVLEAVDTLYVSAIAKHESIVPADLSEKSRIKTIKQMLTGLVVGVVGMILIVVGVFLFSDYRQTGNIKVSSRRLTNKVYQEILTEKEKSLEHLHSNNYFLGIINFIR